ncbi:2-(1,2-epoxy-1,2-dihydrophenyl)acetyl-CoA isomerase [Jannaschia pagri]|uniref:2-(1,2-epoxy-1,2-dihydrophenyl)acetyl-CoA isomerase n=1 Tax=Jannaschia pagri TaxID=2829797 RepID=A0ABQ4NLV8_9RHOB|nr:MULTISPECIES: 2-(1,2-epoxy-1,2-dihydrophenyl)acetyl-CoA isomerase PaaG [unclassified Jannaschia]GIT91540.1 2-(1,2-epoxy-1,2-dihydrophenyl)acetyl-CoA isomerase [Jannaschia sp. AI_61]GIT95374.1 2-(1,2-epoxy-1,2-dihydrophenyl)acetyl-CoA isomerase [Jannaschia sp. AI_62]
MQDSVLITDHGAWVEVMLNRPERLNAFNDDMHAALRAAVDGAATKRALLLTGAGRGFCAGQDLGDRDPAKMDGPPDLGATLTQNYNPLVRALRALPLPVICAVNGVAAGAGANLALACDIVLAAEDARFIQSFSKVGLIPDAGGSWQLTRRLGEARAKALAMTATPITGAQAADWGLIWQALPGDALMDAARALTARLAEGPTNGLAAAKVAIQAAGSQDLDTHLALEAELQRACGQHPNYAEGVAAFLAKRAPRFTP